MIQISTFYRWSEWTTIIKLNDSVFSLEGKPDQTFIDNLGIFFYFSSKENVKFSKPVGNLSLISDSLLLQGLPDKQKLFKYEFSIV